MYSGSVHFSDGHAEASAKITGGRGGSDGRGGNDGRGGSDGRGGRGGNGGNGGNPGTGGRLKCGGGLVGVSGAGTGLEDVEQYCMGCAG